MFVWLAVGLVARTERDNLALATVVLLRVSGSIPPHTRPPLLRHPPGWRQNQNPCAACAARFASYQDPPLRVTTASGSLHRGARLAAMQSLENRMKRKLDLYLWLIPGAGWARGWL